MVTDAYLDVRHHATIQDFSQWTRAAELPLIAVDVVPGAVPIEQHQLPGRCVLIFGQEGPGLTPSALELADEVLFISQHGSTRSINVAAAAAIAMFSWQLQHGGRGDPGSR
jgi:tRNA G18 (ribose-2'-O)-methylase SpoU